MLLLDNNARLDCFSAAMLGMKGVVSEMIEVRPSVVSTPGPHGISMLSHAIAGKKQASEVFELLLEAGADVNAKDKMSMTPLSAAVHASNAEQVEELLRRGADPANTNSKGNTILDIAKRRKNEQVIGLIQKALSKAAK